MAKLSASKLRGMLRPKKAEKPDRQGPEPPRSRFQRAKTELKRKVARNEAALNKVLESFKTTEMGQALLDQKFDEEFDRKLEEIRAAGPQKYAVSGRRDYYRARVLPYETWLFLNSGMTEPQRRKAIEALRRNHAVDLADDAKPPRLAKNNDPVAITLRAFITYPPGGPGRTTVSRDAAALRHLESRGVMPNELVDLAMQPGEGLEAWKKAHSGAKKPTGDAKKVGKATPTKSDKKPPKSPPEATVDVFEGGLDSDADLVALEAVPGLKPVKVRVVLPPPLRRVPYGTTIAILDRRPGRHRILVREIERVQAKGINIARAKRLISHLTTSLLGYKDEWH